jgi:hypothetical protein
VPVGEFRASIRFLNPKDTRVRRCTSIWLPSSFGTTYQPKGLPLFLQEELRMNYRSINFSPDIPVLNKGEDMSVQEIKARFQAFINEYQPIDPYELRRIFSEAIREWEIERGWEDTKKGEPWTDDQLRAILSDAPTKENCLKHARAYNRGYGAIEQIYRWAATSDREIRRKRPNDAFLAQIKRIAKQLAWRA